MASKIFLFITSKNIVCYLQFFYVKKRQKMLKNHSILWLLFNRIYPEMIHFICLWSRFSAPRVDSFWLFFIVVNMSLTSVRWYMVIKFNHKNNMCNWFKMLHVFSEKIVMIRHSIDWICIVLHKEAYLERK